MTARPVASTSTAAMSGDTVCDLRVGGMDCAGCAATVERALRGLDGVRDVRVDVVGGLARVAYAEGRLGRDDLAAAVRRVGYTVEDAREQPGARPDVAPSFWQRRGHLATTLVAGVALVLGLLAQWGGLPVTITYGALGVATVAAGWFVVPRGARAARARALDMNFLMSVAAAGAWAIGEPEEAAATLFLFAVAELLERHSMDRARRAIRSLMALAPAEATVVRGGREIRVPAADVAIAETVVVRPGEKLPIDGVVVDGHSGVNQAPITGESVPVDKAPGDDVFAGTINEQGMLRVCATRPASDTTLARIVHAVEEAQASRAPSQSFVERFARIYTPAVVGAALLLAVVPPLLGLGTWATWVYRALATLVVACPCALVISTPVAVVSGLAGAARAGILIKGGAYLERLADVTAVAFDKTGTLTEGRPEVTEVIVRDKVPATEVLWLAAGVERHSEHPLARAVVAHARAHQVEIPDVPDVSEFEALPGRGARARVGDVVVHVGSARMGAALGGLTDADRALLRRLESDGKTAVLVMRADRLAGVIGLADRVRPGARDAVAALRAAGVGHVAMLTGDNAVAARAVAEAVGIDDVHAELLPEDKMRVVRTLQRVGARVAMVGDGVNDAPAMAEATVGVAMGAAGTDVALETADVALMGDDLSALADAVRRARATRAIIRQNVAFALAIKAVFLVLAVTGWATLWMAVAADMGASLAVVANGLRAVGRARR